MYQPAQANTSIFNGEVLDTVANLMSWVVLVVAPIVGSIIGIAVFWLVHILPAKNRPQADKSAPEGGKA